MKKLICIAFVWHDKNRGVQHPNAPKKGEIVTVISTSADSADYYVLKGYAGNWHKDGFRPPVEISSEVMESFTTVHETVEPLVLEPA